MESYKDRATKEYNELKERHGRLYLFFSTRVFIEGVPKIERKLLRDQYDVMTKYLEILELRISLM